MSKQVQKILALAFIFVTPIIYYALYSYLICHGEPELVTAILCGFAGGLTLFGLLTKLESIDIDDDDDDDDDDEGGA